MSLAIGGMTAEQGMTIADTDCVETSFPNFETMLTELLIQSS
jgi:3-phosphoshikimate 1-carboxyvinyltransferase